jgi:hypothetical protein
MLEDGRPCHVIELLEITECKFAVIDVKNKISEAAVIENIIYKHRCDDQCAGVQQFQPDRRSFQGISLIPNLYRILTSQPIPRPLNLCGSPGRRPPAISEWNLWQ